jgi:sialate O-acetylesterase
MLWLITVSLLAANASRAEVQLPALVGSGMVLQRDAKIRIWGWADPREEVRIDFQGKHVKVSADQTGRWSTSLGPYPAGGPYDMTVAGRNSLTLQDILVGDVWLASGQSNMEWPIKGVRGEIDNADVEIAGANFPRIRLFRVEQKTAPKPESQTASKAWHAVTPDRVADFSAVAYLFGRELHQRYHVPIGLIQAAWGGTAAEAWMSESALRGFPDFQEPIKALASASASGRAEHELYAQQKADWYRNHALDDRGRAAGIDVWAAPDFDASRWPTLALPRRRVDCGEDFGGYSGVVWFRRTINVPPDQLGKPMLLKLGNLVQQDVTFLNGHKIGESQGFGTPRRYVVPARHVVAGENTLVVRLTGINEPSFSCTAMVGPAEQMSAEIGAKKIALDGTWSYMPGPDLGDYPKAKSTMLAANPSPNTPTALYNGMISPIVPMRIKGVIWYQGEANADRPVQYRTLFPTLIEDWRRQWGYQFPFLFVQLAGFGANKPEPADYQSAELREAQGMTLSLSATGMATAIDLGNEQDIHPTNKQDVARRLALAAAKIAYGEDVVFSGPTYQSMYVEGNRARIKFSNLGSGLSIKDNYGYVRGFEIAASDGRFRWAQAEVDGQDILVFNKGVSAPIAVRYSWRNTPDGNVYNKEGLPVIPFRTDAPAPPVGTR